jgi:hypothetical protein
MRGDDLGDPLHVDFFERANGLLEAAQVEILRRIVEDRLGRLAVPPDLLIVGVDRAERPSVELISAAPPASVSPNDST